MIVLTRIPNIIILGPLILWFYPIKNASKLQLFSQRCRSYLFDVAPNTKRLLGTTVTLGIKQSLVSLGCRYVLQNKPERERERGARETQGVRSQFSMDRYQRVEKPKEGTPINENEMRITTQGRMRNYITYATTLLQEKDSNEIVLKAMGRAINKTVMIAELIKRRIADLHQDTSIGSTDITDVWEPLEEGLLPLETTRHVSMIIITLSKKELDTSSTGYQPPIPVDQVKPLNDFEYDGEGLPSMRGRGRGGRGRSRGRGNYNGAVDYNGEYWDGGHSYGARGRGRGRARGFWGWGRGYGGRDSQHQQGGYYDYGEAEPLPAQVRGRGRGRGRAWGRGRGRGRNYRSDGPV
ncbi:uncharacterized protein LOC131160302 isoform X2 [Malania oleifera]|uniref:uncharacterized protein LOC131160302 isoform X2 n=1 Tax=Malania oleifera TaxID=397392 RepID=UPI0025AE2F77|nr:uncharacterized protein LOC131160302 isoform X2 [Malania oleifera]